MDEQNNRRPGVRRETAVSREQPRTPRSRPAGGRARTGNAASREEARARRMAGREADREVEEVEDLEETRPDDPAPAPAKKRKKRKKKPHRIYNTNFGFKFLTMLAVVAVILLSMVLFFKVKHIYVEIIPPTDENGETAPHSYYTPEEIIDASGILIDDNLLSLRKASVASRIHAALPYVNEIQIKKKLPGSVILTVSEFQVTYGIEDASGQWWLISRDGRILESCDAQTARSHLVIKGMQLQPSQLGDYIKPIASEGADLEELAAKRTSVIAVLKSLEDKPFAKQIRSLDVSTSYDIVLWYGNQYEIKLGNTDQLEYKFQFLQSAILELGRDRSGTIDVSFNETNDIRFLPFSSAPQ